MKEEKSEGGIERGRAIKGKGIGDKEALIRQSHHAQESNPRLFK